MKTLFLPFGTARFDRRQGIFARQIPRWVAGVLRKAGADTMWKPWFAHRGDELAHVLIEGELPAQVARAEADKAGAAAAVRGRVEVTPYRVALTARWIDAEREREFTLENDGDLPAACDALGQWAADALRVSWPDDSLPTRVPAALESWLYDRDNAELVAVGGIGVLADADDAFCHLAAAIAADPELRRAEHLLAERAEAWAAAGLATLADACNDALARLPRAVET